MKLDLTAKEVLALYRVTHDFVYKSEYGAPSSILISEINGKLHDHLVSCLTSKDKPTTHALSKEQFDAWQADQEKKLDALRDAEPANNWNTPMCECHCHTSFTHEGVDVEPRTFNLGKKV